jgi:phosphonate transport system substrate-binding protein
VTLMFATRQTRRLAVVYAIATLLFDIILGSHAVGQTPGRVEAKTITLGIVAPINQKEIEEHFHDFVRYVARKLSSAPAIEGRIVVAPTQSGLASLLTERKVDFYMESPYPTYLINNVYGAGKLLLRRWKGGMAEYHALIFTKRDGETKRLEDLRGKIIAFEDPGSTSGHFLPKFFLSRRGFKLSEKTRIEPKVSPGEVGYIFAYSQAKLVDLVLTKQVAAGAFSNDDYATLDERKKSDITILAETDRLPRHLVSVRRDLAPVLANRLEKILLSMHQDPEGQVILQRTDGTTKFDALPGGELAMRQRLLDTFYSPEKK